MAGSKFSPQNIQSSFCSISVLLQTILRLWQTNHNLVFFMPPFQHHASKPTLILFLTHLTVTSQGPSVAMIIVHTVRPLVSLLFGAIPFRDSCQCISPPSPPPACQSLCHTNGANLQTCGRHTHHLHSPVEKGTRTRTGTGMQAQTSWTAR